MTAQPALTADSDAPAALHQNLLAEALRRVVLEFFESYEVPCEEGGEPHAPLSAEVAEVGSIIGFRGGNVYGGLAFVAPATLVAKLLPVPRKTDDADGQLRDWCSEIANQLLGRLKNRVARYDLDFDVGTPVCFLGHSIRLVFLPDAEGTSLSFKADAHEMRVHLDCSYERSPSGVSAAPTESLRIVAEGDVVLF